MRVEGAFLVHKFVEDVFVKVSSRWNCSVLSCWKNGEAGCGLLMRISEVRYETEMTSQP
jgi:hypothetical protein